MFKRYVAIVCTIGLISACSTNSNKTDIRATDPKAIVESALRRNGWKNFQIVKLDTVEGGFRVYVEELPRKPGGHTYLEVSKEGKLSNVIPGY